MKGKINTKVHIEMQYVIAENGNDSNYIKDASLSNRANNSNDFKKTLFPIVRANYRSEFYTKNKNLGQLLTEVQDLMSTDQHKKLIDITQRLQNYISENTTRVYPNLKQTSDEIVKDDITNSLIIEKNKLVYSTIIYRKFEQESNFEQIETVMLDFLQEYIDNGLSKFIELGAHFSCTYYYIDKKHIFTLEEFVKHRRENLKLKDNSHLEL